MNIKSKLRINSQGYIPFEFLMSRARNSNNDPYTNRFSRILLVLPPAFQGTLRQDQGYPQTVPEIPSRQDQWYPPTGLGVPPDRTRGYPPDRTRGILQTGPGVPSRQDQRYPPDRTRGTFQTGPGVPPDRTRGYSPDRTRGTLQTGPGVPSSFTQEGLQWVPLTSSLTSSTLQKRKSKPCFNVSQHSWSTSSFLVRQLKIQIA